MHSKEIVPTKLFFENLDGLRFFCFFVVFLDHTFHTDIESLRSSYVYNVVTRDLFGNGNLGVNFFFVLSGFLITYLLIKERELNGKINILNFWIRRTLRIWPLYFMCVIFGFIIFPFLKSFFGEIPDESANVWYYVFLISNFDFIYSGPPDASILSALWSIAIEEQFYLVWPLLLTIIPKRMNWLLFTAIIAASLVFRASFDTLVMHDKHTLSCIGDMAIGALGAWFVQFDKVKLFVKGLSKRIIISLYVTLILVYFFRNDVLTVDYYLRIVERFFTASIMLFVILEQNYCDNSLFKMSNFKYISGLGRISYGLYSLHFIGILIAINITNLLGINTELWQVLILETIAALVITILLSRLSYRYFEQPFLRAKKRFSYFIQ